MKANEFDNLVKEKFEQAEFEYAPANWEKLAGELPPGKTIAFSGWKWISVAGIAASLLMVVGVLAWLYNSAPQDAQPVVAKTPVSAKVAAPASVPQQVQPAATQPPASAAVQNRIAHTPAPAKVRVMATPVVADKKTQEPEIVKETTPPLKYGTVVDKVEELGQITEHKKPEPAFAFNDIPLPQSAAKPSGKTFLSVTGGVNYGSLNTGYMAGINARQKLGSKVYVEGDLTVLSQQSNQTATVTGVQYTAFDQGLAGKPGVTNTVTPNEANLLYVQFNPSIGYQVVKKLSVSVGPDLQKLVDNNNDLKTIVLVDDQPKLVPGLDVGITGKTEYSVTPRLKAGVLYREGINNIVNGGGNQYFDRRYLQVQLKFRVLGRN